MKAAICIPCDLFEQVERLARHTKKSRSQLFTQALREYLARHAPDDVIEATNRAWAESENSGDAFVLSAARCTLERSEW